MRDTYFGTDRDDAFSATSAIRESFYGLGGNDTFYFYDLSTGPTPPSTDFDSSDRFFGGTGRDQLTNITVNFDGAEGAGKLDALSFDGGAGYDTLTVAVAIDMESYNSKISTFRFDDVAPLVRSVEHREFNVTLSRIGATTNELQLLGGNRDETVRLTQDASMDASGVIRVDLGGGDDRFEFSASVYVASQLIVNTGKGADTVIMNASGSSYPSDFGATIRTGAGADTIVLEGMYSETLNAGAGNDQIYVLTGSFAEAPDIIRTGAGRDRVYVELDSYSTVARLRDFSAARDTIVFDSDEFRNTDVTFDKAVWQGAGSDRLYMDNAAGKLYFGDNVLVNFGGPTDLTAANFVTDSWDI
ncbi:MAG: hypothetical protein AB7S99_22585 [Pseudodonghicola sp.]